MPRMDRIAVSDSQTNWINIWSTLNSWVVFQNIKLNQIIPLWVQRSCQQVLNSHKNAKKKSSHSHWSILARVNGSGRYFISYAKSWRDGKMDWTFMSFQECSDWKTSGIFEGFIGNFKTLLRISSSCRIHILFSPNTNFCLTRSIAALRVGGHRLDRRARIQFGRVHLGCSRRLALCLRHSARIGPSSVTVKRFLKHIAKIQGCFFDWSAQKVPDL